MLGGTNIPFVQRVYIDDARTTYAPAYSRYAKMCQYYLHSTSHSKNCDLRNIALRQWHSEKSGTTDRRRSARLNDWEAIKKKT